MKKSKDIDDMLSSVKTDLPPSSTPNLPDETEIAVRAYEIYESKGRLDGEDLDDWLRVESELKQRVTGSL